MPIIDSIGTRIREARLAKGMSQEGLGSLLGITKGAVSAWESGKNSPKRSIMPAVAAALGVSELDLWEGRFLGEATGHPAPVKPSVQLNTAALTPIEGATLDLLSKVLAQHKLTPAQCLEYMSSWQSLLDSEQHHARKSDDPQT